MCSVQAIGSMEMVLTESSTQGWLSTLCSRPSAATMAGRSPRGLPLCALNCCTGTVYASTCKSYLFQNLSIRKTRQALLCGPTACQTAAREMDMPGRRYHLRLIVQLRGRALLLRAALGNVSDLCAPLRHAELLWGLSVEQQGAVLKAHSLSCTRNYAEEFTGPQTTAMRNLES